MKLVLKILTFLILIRLSTTTLSLQYYNGDQSCSERNKNTITIQETKEHNPINTNAWRQQLVTFISVDIVYRTIELGVMLCYSVDQYNNKHII